MEQNFNNVNEFSKFLNYLEVQVNGKNDVNLSFIHCFETL